MNKFVKGKQVVDWGKNGYIAAIFEGEVHLWHPTKLKRHITRTQGKVRNCVMWNTTGTHFAMSLVRRRIAICDAKAEKVRLSTYFALEVIFKDQNMTYLE